MDADEEGMVDGGQDVSLHHNPLGLPFLLDVLFLHRLEGVELSIDFLPNQDYFGIGTFSDY